MEESLSGAKGCFGGSSTLGAEITIEGVDCGFEHHVAVRAGFQVALDLDLHRRGKPPL
jgi:hypothetical protein